MDLSSFEFALQSHGYAPLGSSVGAATDCPNGLREINIEIGDVHNVCSIARRLECQTG
jgi:hypothetical protein